MRDRVFVSKGEIMVRFGMAAAALALMASPLLAQESTEQLKKELQELRAEVDAMKAVHTTKEIPSSGKVEKDGMAADDNPVKTLFKQTKLSGYVAAQYQFKFNALHGDVANTDPVRLFDNRDNSFYLNAAQINLERLASKDMIVGYHLEIAAGHDPDVYDGQTITLQEGWVQIMAPIGDGLDIRAGRMATLVGYEVLESPNNMNTSRGLLFSFVQPFTHTGVRAAYNFGETASATIGFNNGLNPAGSDQFSDNDHGKMVELQLALKPMKDLSAAVTLLFGNDTANISNSVSDNFYVFDIVVAYTMDKLTLALNVDFASAQGALAPNNRAAFSGFAAYAKYQVTDSFAGALRFEYMSDKDGAFFGPVVAGDSGTGARMLGVTLTGELKVAQQLILRVELRSDNSNQHNFGRDTENSPALKPARGDTSLGFEAIMPF
jgi:hypothetical protein